MNLETNLIDNIIECEVKLGHAHTPISFYYPKSSLLELLDCSEADFLSCAEAFVKGIKNTLGEVTISEVKSEPGRYQVTVSADGVDWVSLYYKPSDFIKRFAVDIHKTGNTLCGILETFKTFSNDIVVEKVKENEWGIYFLDDSIDPYVYYIEENSFGLEYHRFTHKAYRLLLED